MAQHKLPPLPRPDQNQYVPHAEDFAAWCENPVTRFVARAFERAANKQREAWTEETWVTGVAEPESLAVYRARADAYMAFLETGLERYVELTET